MAPRKAKVKKSVAPTKAKGNTEKTEEKPPVETTESTAPVETPEVSEVSDEKDVKEPSKKDAKEVPLPVYVCHKKVQAQKITGITFNPNIAKTRLHFKNPNMEVVHVDNDFMQKHKPEVDGYYVRYSDGYESFSPEKAFEEGYSREKK